ncbi:WD40 repeat-like protein [Eremomyces bilateralis CBS 781.70]|uniref:WD40 repeat-like protein n=1 Tax=Eremomyces bilateralis CBS 781.70 TaxID=1392243 RepID=A0A6G1FYG2_9PEZI|nr:WD40 repeat-like protein [Eremomyces bilateralis CBS 781.70]KAF1810887.1 WD40 repeat-like protein [Eremomyces bilateralis CBS 781.70]
MLELDINSTIYADPAMRLPPELMIEILGYLDARSLSRSELVSGRWAALSRSQHCWRASFLSAYKPTINVTPQPRMMGGLGIGTKPNGTQDYKQMYKARHLIEGNWLHCSPRAIYFTGHTDSVYCCQFDEDKLITGSRDRTIRVWSMRDFRCLKVIGGPASRPVRDDPETRLPTHPHATVMDRPSLNGTSEGNEIYHIPEQYHQASILCLHYDDTHMVTGSSDTTCLVWDLATFEPVRRLRKHSAGVLDVCMDSTRIISCSKDATICLWDRATGDLLGVLTGHNGPVNAVQLRGNLLVSASGDGVAKLWNLQTQKCIRDFPSKDRGLAAVEFSADTRFVLAGGNDQVIYKFDSATGELLHTYRGHTGLVRSLFLDSVNGRVISGSYDQSMRVYSFDGAARSKRYMDWTTSWILAAKGDYRRIVATSQDGRAVLMDYGWAVEGVEMLRGEGV